MKFLFTADIHLSRYGQDKVHPDSNLPERLNSIKDTLYQMGQYCRDNDINTFIIGGDIMHSKSIIYSIAQELLLQFLSDFEDIVFWILDGNHDLSGKGSDAISSLSALRNIPHVQWITGKPEGDPSQLFVPYTHNVVNDVKNGKSEILLSHFGLSEGVLNSGISIVSQIKLADLIGKYKLVLLGHYHKPQEIIRDDIQLYYVGSPIQLDWGEKGDEKRFLIVDTNTLQVESVPTTGYKKHVQLEINSSNRDQILEQAQKAKEAGDLVKLVKTETVEIDSDEFSVIDKSEKDITNRGITSSMSEADKLQRFLEIKEIPADKIERYMNVGLGIINNCEGE